MSASDASRTKIKKTKLEIPNNEPSTCRNNQSSDCELLEKVRNQAGYRGKLILYRHGTTPYQDLSESVQKVKLDITLQRTGKHNGSLA